MLLPVLLATLFQIMLVTSAPDPEPVRHRPPNTRRLLQFHADQQGSLEFDRAARSRWTRPGARWKSDSPDARSAPDALSSAASSSSSHSHLDYDQREQRDLARHQLDRYTAGGFAAPPSESMDSGIVEGGPHEAHRQPRITHPLNSKYRFSAGYQADPTFPEVPSEATRWSSNVPLQQQHDSWSDDARDSRRPESGFANNNDAPWETPVFNPETVSRERQLHSQPVHAQPRAAIPPLPVDARFLLSDHEDPSLSSRASHGTARRIESFPSLQNQPGLEYEDAIRRRTLLPTLPSTAAPIADTDAGWRSTPSWKLADNTNDKSTFSTTIPRITSVTKTTPTIIQSSTSTKVTPTTAKATPTTAKITSPTAKVTTSTTKPVPVTTIQPTTTPKVTSTTKKVTSTTPEATSTPKVTSVTSKVTSTTPKVSTTTQKVTSTTPEVTSTIPKVTITVPNILVPNPKLTTTWSLVNATNPKDLVTTEFISKMEVQMSPEFKADTSTGGNYNPSHTFHDLAGIDDTTTTILDDDDETHEPSIGTMFELSEDFTADHMTVRIAYPASGSSSEQSSDPEVTNTEIIAAPTTDNPGDISSDIAIVSEYTASEDFAGTMTTMPSESSTFDSKRDSHIETATADNSTLLAPIVAKSSPKLAETAAETFGRTLIEPATNLSTAKVLKEFNKESTTVNSTIYITTMAPSTSPPRNSETSTISKKESTTTAAAATTTTTITPATTTITVLTTRLPSTEMTKLPPTESNTKLPLTEPNTKLPPTESNTKLPLTESNIDLPANESNTKLAPKESSTTISPKPPTSNPSPTEHITTIRAPDMTTLRAPDPETEEPSPAQRPTSRRRLPSYRPLIRHRVNRPPAAGSPTGPPDSRPATRRPPKASRIPTTTRPPPTTTFGNWNDGDEESSVTDWFTPPMPTEPTTTKRQYVITVPPLVDHVEPRRRHNNGDEDETNVINPSAESTLGATATIDEQMQHSGDGSVIPEGATNAIIISGIIGGVAIVFFAVLMGVCMWRQHVSRRPIYPPSSSSGTSTSSTGTFNGRFR